MVELVRHTPKNCITDNLSVHETGAVDTFLEQNPLGSSTAGQPTRQLAQQVELFFSILEGGTASKEGFTSTDELADGIQSQGLQQERHFSLDPYESHMSQ
jgi:hypothetical protein